MYKYEEKIFQELPPIIPKMVNSYSSDKIVIFQAKNVFSEPKGFDSYKFHIINSQMPKIKIDGKKFTEIPGHIFPINPQEHHGYEVHGEVDPYIAFFVDKDLVQDTAYNLYKNSNVYFKLENLHINSNITKLINTFFEESTSQQTGYEFILQGLNIQVVTLLLRLMEHNFKKGIREKKYKHQNLIKLIKDFFMENYCNDFCLEDLAKMANYSPYYFIKIFKDNTGKTPFEYFIDIKIEKAKEMLTKSNNTITEICFTCGFKNRTHFSKVFKKKVGVSPLQYRKMVI